jgi:dTDP-4-dehydrorhamnose reductase
MKIAITGAGGLLGYALVRVFSERHAVHPLTRAEVDITDPEQLHACFSRIVPEVVIHAAAIRDVDVAESDPAEAFRVNFHGTRQVVEAARAVGAAVAYISTDAVFDGAKDTPYLETDAANPITVYGRTKLRGEQVAAGLPCYWIFRISVLFGPGRTNFVDKALRTVARGEEYVAASDQTGTATYTLDAARTIRDVIESGRCGLYHVANQGGASRLEFARRAAEIAGLDPAKVIGRPSAGMGRRAARPKYVVMAMEALKRAGFTLPRPWPEALEEYVRPLPAARSAAAD